MGLETVCSVVYWCMTHTVTTAGLPGKQGDKMRFRYTNKELREYSDRRLIAAVLVERMSDCKNQYAPLYKRLNETHHRVSNGLKLLDTPTSKSGV